MMPAAPTAFPLGNFSNSAASSSSTFAMTEPLTPAAETEILEKSGKGRAKRALPVEVGRVVLAWELSP
jgi:hypothetical protein